MEIERSHCDQCQRQLRYRHRTEIERLRDALLDEEVLGVDRVVSLVDQPEYVQLFEQLGIDVAVSPRNATAEEIIRFTHEKVALNITVLENDQAEVIELKLNEDSELAGRTIRAIDESVDADVVFGAMSRAGDLVIPRGDTVLQPGDNVVIFVETGFVTEMLEMG